MVAYLIVLLIGLSWASDGVYLEHLSKFGKSYAIKEEFEFRKAVFESNLAKIQKHNSDPSRTYTMAVNRMTDWTSSEFKRLLGYNPEPLIEETNEIQEEKFSYFNWADQNILSEVKDQQ